MFAGRTAWFAPSVPDATRELWKSHKGAVEDDPKDARLLFVSSSADLPTKPDPVIAPTAATPPLADAALKTTDAAAAPEAPGDLAAIETPAAATDAPAAAPVATPVAVVAARARPTRGRGRGGRGGHVASGRATAAASSSVATGASTAGNKKEREPFYFDVTFVGDCLDQKKWLPLGQYIVTKHDSDEEAKSDDVVSQAFVPVAPDAFGKPAVDDRHGKKLPHRRRQMPKAKTDEEADDGDAASEQTKGSAKTTSSATSAQAALTSSAKSSAAPLAAKASVASGRKVLPLKVVPTANVKAPVPAAVSAPVILPPRQVAAAAAVVALEASSSSSSSSRLQPPQQHHLKPSTAWPMATAKPVSSFATNKEAYKGVLGIITGSSNLPNGNSNAPKLFSTSSVNGNPKLNVFVALERSPPKPVQPLLHSTIPPGVVGSPGHHFVKKRLFSNEDEPQVAGAPVKRPALLEFLSGGSTSAASTAQRSVSSSALPRIPPLSGIAAAASTSLSSIARFVPQQRRAGEEDPAEHPRNTPQAPPFLELLASRSKALQQQQPQHTGRFQAATLLSDFRSVEGHDYSTTFK